MVMFADIIGYLRRLRRATDRIFMNSLWNPDVSNDTTRARQSARLSIVYEGVAFGGVEEHVLLLLRHLRRAGFVVDVITPGSMIAVCPVLFRERLAELDIPHIVGTPPRSRLPNVVSDITFMRQVFLQQRTSIVHIHNSNPDGGRRATIAARLARVPVVVRSEHLPPSANLDFHSSVSLKLTDWMTDRFIVGSESCRDEQLSLLGRDPQKTQNLYYGVDLDRFDPDHNVPAAKRALGLDPAIKTVGKVARLSPEKGHEYFIRSAAQVIATRGPTNFLIVGNGPRDAELRLLTENLSISPYVHFLGYQADTVPLIEAMDVTVMSSINEGISLAMLENMAMGKPVVTSDEPSFVETVVDGESGIVVPRRDPAAMAAALVRVLDDPALISRLGKAAHTRVHAVFSAEVFVQQLVALYNGLLHYTPDQQAAT